MKLFDRLSQPLKGGKSKGTPSGQPVQDKQGETFWLRTDLYEDGGHVIWLEQPGQNVGCAKLYRDTSTSCAIEEIKVSEGYRGRGLGTILVSEIFRLAQVDGLTMLWGWVTLADFLSTPHLLDWYVRCGFQVHCDNTEIRHLLAQSHEDQEHLIVTQGSRSVAQIRKVISSM